MEVLDCLAVLEGLEPKVRDISVCFLFPNETRQHSREEHSLTLTVFAGLSGAPGLDGLNGLGGPKGLSGTPGKDVDTHSHSLIMLFLYI